MRSGELVGSHFRAEALAGRGGMGAVYRAVDTRSGDRVALKVVSGSFDLAGERFGREIELLAANHHPALVRHIAHGEHQGAPWLAMEWLDGEDLEQRLARAGLTVDETLSLWRRIAAALGALHAQGVVHRDVKPSDVFLCDRDSSRATLLDLGIARPSVRTRVLTRAVAMLGTVGYMSPEQAFGAPDVDARADMYSLGCVIYECLAGRPAFEGAHPIAVLAKLLQAEVTPLSEPARPMMFTHTSRCRWSALAGRPARFSEARCWLRSVRRGRRRIGLRARLSVRSRSPSPSRALALQLQRD
ncbi:MAG: serine/threonine-protein kinase [Deltaproteobacteria bacterium]